MVSHESVVNTLDFEIGLRRKRGMGKDDPCIQIMSVSADMSGAPGRACYHGLPLTKQLAK